MSIGKDRFRSLYADSSVFLTSLWYSTPPTEWPRHLCEFRLVNCISKRFFWIPLATILVVYFLVMDIILFTRYGKVQLAQESVVGAADEMYSPFSHLSVKGLLNDHVSQYIIAPSTEYFDTITQFSSTFTFITPNMISCAHFLCGLVSGKFLASEHLQDRRIGVMLYEYRTWLDSLDGTVYRSRAGLRLKYHSNHSSSGYFIDSIADITGGLFLCLGILYHLIKKFGGSNRALPTSNKAELNTPVVSDRSETYYTRRYLFNKVLLFGLSLAVAGKCWDLAVDDFTNVYEYIFKDLAYLELQTSYSHSTTTLVLFYAWRLVGGQSVLNYVLIAIFMDKTWEFLQHMPVVFLATSSFLYLITFIYILQVIRLAYKLKY